MSDWQKRKQKLKKNAREKARSDQCCILCQLRAQAETQDEAWSLSDRADELVARMRAMHEWDGGFVGILDSRQEFVQAFMDSWAQPRMPLAPGDEVALMTLDRFWRSYHALEEAER
jgi:molybdopterin converting factor small subunit